MRRGPARGLQTCRVFAPLGAGGWRSRCPVPAKNNPYMTEKLRKAERVTRHGCRHPRLARRSAALRAAPQPAPLRRLPAAGSSLPGARAQRSQLPILPGCRELLRALRCPYRPPRRGQLPGTPPRGRALAGRCARPWGAAAAVAVPTRPRSGTRGGGRERRPPVRCRPAAAYPVSAAGSGGQEGVKASPADSQLMGP